MRSSVDGPPPSASGCVVFVPTLTLDTVFWETDWLCPLRASTVEE